MPSSSTGACKVDSCPFESKMKPSFSAAVGSSFMARPAGSGLTSGTVAGSGLICGTPAGSGLINGTIPWFFSMAMLVSSELGSNLRFLDGEDIDALAREGIGVSRMLA